MFKYLTLHAITDNNSTKSLKVISGGVPLFIGFARKQPLFLLNMALLHG